MPWIDKYSPDIFNLKMEIESISNDFDILKNSSLIMRPFDCSTSLMNWGTELHNDLHNSFCIIERLIKVVEVTLYLEQQLELIYNTTKPPRRVIAIKTKRRKLWLERRD